MVRHVIAASGALMVLVALPLAPPAAADDGQMIVTPVAKSRCLVSADNFARGGGPMVVCEHLDGSPWGTAQYALEKNSSRLTLAIERGTGEFRWDKGPLSDGGDTGQPVVVDAGQTYRVNGWTIQGEELRTRFTYDATGHGMLLSAADERGF